MKIDHIGIVVKSLSESISHWEECFGYKTHTEPVINSRQKVKVVFLQKSDSLMIKLIEATGDDSPVYKFAQKGGGLHHLCFKCDEINEEVPLMKKSGYMLLTPPQPGEAFENENIAFLLSSQGINIELIDTDSKANLISKSR